jgi:hypothetical protein
MSHPEDLALDQAEGALGLLSAEERADAQELIGLARRLFPSPLDVCLADRTQLLRLIEVLARRSATAMPFAALGRALSARLAGDEASVSVLLREFQTKLQMLGL